MKRLYRILFLIENVIGTYRNYCIFNRKQQILIFMRLLTDLLFLYFITIITVVGSVLLILLSITNLITLTTMLSISLKRSSDFFTLIKHLKITHSNYKKVQHMKIMTLYFAILTFSLLSTIPSHELFFFQNSYIGIFLEFCVHVFNNLRFIATYYWYLLLSSTINYLLSCTERDIRQVTNNKVIVDHLDNDSIEDVPPSNGYSIEDDIKRWAAHCESLITCIKKLNRCFSLQILLCQCSAIPLFIHIISAVMESVIKQETRLITVNPASVFVNLLIYFSFTIFVLKSGQNLHNSWMMLFKTIVKLEASLLNHPEMRGTVAVRDLVRLVRLEPARAQFLSTTPVEMSLLPSIVSFFVTYVIVSLQFNKTI